MGNGTLQHCLRESRRTADREVFAQVMARLSSLQAKRAEKEQKSTKSDGENT
ncbi:MAG: hypothetical protein GX139_01240 [Armatimonadetes bacterium]|jgi:hypothetical protein|nr:hypothetical protein [Armatimonadota bacterium]